MMWTYDGGHGVLGSGGDQDTQVRLAVAHAHAHGRRRLGLHVLTHVPRRDQQTRGVAVVSIPVSYGTVKEDESDHTHTFTIL